MLQIIKDNFKYSDDAREKIERLYNFSGVKKSVPAWVITEEILVMTGYKEKIDTRINVQFEKKELEFLYNAVKKYTGCENEGRKLKEILNSHKKWLNKDGGVRANFRDADLRSADFRGADLKDANIRDVDLRRANLDYSSWALSCTTKIVKLCKKLQAQLLAHAFRVSPDCKPTEDQMDFIRENFHRYKEFWGEEK